MTSSVRNALVTSPPSMGAATRFMISAPAPSAPKQRQQADGHRGDGHDLGTQSLNGPFSVGLDDVFASSEPALAHAAMEGLVDVDHHHDTGLHREADRRQQADPDGRGHRVVKQEERPEAPHQGEWHRNQHDERLGHVLELQEKQRQTSEAPPAARSTSSAAAPRPSAGTDLSIRCALRARGAISPLAMAPLRLACAAFT